MFFLLFLLISIKTENRPKIQNKNAERPNTDILKLHDEKEYPKIFPQQRNYLGKPLSTLTPKPTFTPFKRPVNYDYANDLPLPYNADDENSDSVKADIARQLVSTPMIVFYSILAVCVIVAVGIFMLYANSQNDEYKEDAQEAAAMESQLNETLDPQLANEAPLQL